MGFRSLLSDSRLITVGLLFGLWIAAGEPLASAAPSGYAPHGTITVDGVTVPDIGPMPTHVPTPPTNLSYDQKVELGKQLYFDNRLSKNNSVSCAFCHNPGTGFADARQFSIGAFGTAGGRQAPTVYNTGFIPLQFWDGRANSLEEQAIGPIHNPVEMAEAHHTVVPKIAKIPAYQKQFQLIFGGGASLQHIAEAIAAFERTIVSQNSAFDKHVMGEAGAMNEAAIRGLALFKGKARCILCHNGPNFTDNKFHNLGVPQAGQLKEDLGRYMVTRAEKDKGAFKTPTLRSVIETAPYMHDGVFKTLEEVVEFYDRGGGGNPHLSPLIKPLGLTAEEKADLLEFLKALTGAPLKITVPKLPK
ncbi:MAG TPA: cytochrome c peroxidase [Nitrospira sp.]|nr:cytochrome c peroxidase [Nitrospira sp.]